jgi:hypothetical protein
MPRRGMSFLNRTGRHLGRLVVIPLALLPIVLAACGGSSPSNAAAPSSSAVVQVTGTGKGWVFHDGQTVTVSMGSNGLFKPLSHVNIIQCSDPGAKAENLPKKFLQCDENTIQADTVVVHSGGSFSEPGYTVFKLPSTTTLGESKDGAPVCNQAIPCVLLVSEYQTDLSKPKAFSHPFTVLPPSGSQGRT